MLKNVGQLAVLLSCSLCLVGCPPCSPPVGLFELTTFLDCINAQSAVNVFQFNSDGTFQKPGTPNHALFIAVWEQTGPTTITMDVRAENVSPPFYFHFEGECINGGADWEGTVIKSVGDASIQGCWIMETI